MDVAGLFLDFISLSELVGSSFQFIHSHAAIELADPRSFLNDINILRLLVTCYVSSQLCVSKFIAFAITILYEQI